ncbi:hypothetical protein D5S17_14715 [Pseudonocardiaceae bacterium YIM PH 21723]|nr:hypothetical protein D5S17_14715 [Pseudonocardiaceae bacterium YIM PH 21723]
MVRQNCLLREVGIMKQSRWSVPLLAGLAAVLCALVTSAGAAGDSPAMYSRDDVRSVPMNRENLDATLDELFAKYPPQAPYPTVVPTR